MFKKILLSALMLTTSTTAFAYGTPYLGISAGIKTNTANIANYRGLPGNIFVGYGANFENNFLLAGELFLTAGTISFSDNGLRSTWAYGLSILPGLMLSDHTMALARLGLVRAHFTPTGAPTNTISGVQIGVGLQTGLTQNWDLRGEYIYTGYKTLNGVSGSPRGDDFLISLIYKLD